MTEYTWKNLVAYETWVCKLCDEIIGGNIITSRHLDEVHGINNLTIFNGHAYSKSFEYPNVITKIEEPAKKEDE